MTEVSSPQVIEPVGTRESRLAFRFVLLVGILSFFADFTYEGARSVLGPYLAMLGASATIVGIVAGFGELVGYGLRLVSGRAADISGRFWPIMIFGYLLQMTSVPALAFTGSWQAAAVLIILERVGKAIRNPPRDVMLSHAAKHVGGYGYVFGLHEALDQTGALVGPLAVAGVLALRGSYHLAFAVLLVPAVMNLSLVMLARLLYPRPQDMDATPAGAPGRRLPIVFWVYLAGAMLAGAGFADYPLIAYHFSKAHIASGEWIAVFYAVAMAVSGTGAFVCGRLFDKYGFKVLITVTTISVLFAPLVFLGNFWVALAGTGLWGLGIGAHELIIPAAVTPMVPSGRRASAFGLFTAGYGVAWFLGSAAIGILYDQSVRSAITFCVVAELAAIPLFLWVTSRCQAA